MSIETAPAEAAAGAAANQALVLRLIAAMDARDDDAIDELYAERVVMHPLFHRPVSRIDGTPLPEGPMTVTPELRRQAEARQREEFPAIRRAIDALFAADDTVTAVLTARGAHRSGKAVTWTNVVVSRISGGKIVEIWLLWDRLGYWQQLGLIPETPELLRRAQALR